MIFSEDAKNQIPTKVTPVAGGEGGGGQVPPHTGKASGGGSGGGGSGGGGSGGGGSGGGGGNKGEKGEDAEAAKGNTPSISILPSAASTSLPPYAEKLNELYADFVQFNFVDGNYRKMVEVIHQFLAAIKSNNLKKAVEIYNQNSSFFNRRVAIRDELNKAHPQFGGLEVGDKFRDIYFAVEAVVEHISKKIS